MKYDLSEGALFAVQSAYVDLLDAISRSASSQSDLDVGTLQLDAEKFIVAMVASLTLVDGHVTQEEADFLCKLLNISDRPGGAIRYVNEYACRWPMIRKSVPQFFSFAVKHDPEAAREMLLMIQIIGNNLSITDAHFATSERQFVRDCIAQLEAQFDREK